MLSIKRVFGIPVLLTMAIAVTTPACSLRFLNAQKNHQVVSTTSPDPVVSVSSTLSSNDGTVTVSITLPSSAPTGTIIYYTTDGSDPATSDTATIYTVPFVVTGNTETITIKAAAISPGLNASQTISKAPWFGEWEIIGNNYIQYFAVSFSTVSIYVDATGTYMVSDKAYKWNGSSWNIAVNGCSSSDQLEVQSFFISNGIIYCTSYTGVTDVVLKTISGVTTQVGGGLGDGHASIVPCYGTVCAGLSDANNSNKATVKIYNAGTNTWLPLGTGTISTGVASEAVDLFSFKDIVYAAFVDVDSNVVGVGANLIVKKYVNGIWVDISDTSIKSNDTQRRLSMFVYDDGSAEGTVYLALAKYWGSYKPPVVRSYKDGLWSDVGGSGGLVDPTSNYSFDYLKIIVIEGVPYVTYQDYKPAGILPDSGHARTRFFNGTSWEDLGAISYTGDSTHTRATTYNGKLYRNVSGWWIESFGPNGSGIVSGGVEDPLGLLP